MLKIVADENMPLVEPFFDALGKVVRVTGRTMTATQVADADLLLVRSVTPVGPALLGGSKVGFVGSATIGTDHIDQDWLVAQGIGFSNAPGCNAESVVDYVLSALFNLAGREGADLWGKTVGIVGVGNVGRRLQARLGALGLECLLCDPPRAAREGVTFADLDEIIRRCDVICLHTPLTRDGDHPSFHLLDAARLNKLCQGAWLINAGRGGVIDNRALSRCISARPDLRVVLDVWEEEPAIDVSLARQVTLGTPHIAGYSLEGRMRGTEMVYRAACAHLGIEPSVSLSQLLPVPPIRQVVVDPVERLDLRKLINLGYDLRDDHDRLMAALDADAGVMGARFDALRKNYPVRRELSVLPLSGVGSESAQGQILRAVGFDLQDSVS